MQLMSVRKQTLTNLRVRHNSSLSIDAVEQVLDMFRQCFIANVDAKAIVYDLEHTHTHIHRERSHST